MIRYRATSVLFLLLWVTSAFANGSGGQTQAAPAAKTEWEIRQERGVREMEQKALEAAALHRYHANEILPSRTPLAREYVKRILQQHGLQAQVSRVDQIEATIADPWRFYSCYSMLVQFEFHHGQDYCRVSGRSQAATPFCTFSSNREIATLYCVDQKGNTTRNAQLSFQQP